MTTLLEQVIYALASAFLDYLRRRDLAVQEVPSLEDLARDRAARAWLRDHPGPTRPDRGA